MSDDETEFAKDMLRGADEIAQYLFGAEAMRRKVYHLVATSNLPHFKLGSMICARKSVLLKWVEAQEGRYANDNTPLSAKSGKTGNV
jgi:hypothetical protein